ncbi:hypothetical protein M405DRAFT_867775 [Rhizopogon salebrosus TDB-379]|nr:hypothetical protein M405DRAFT_867775 [Rhizopogon salebrosus TDB-379]
MDDKENNEDSTDGPTPRIVEHTVGARPFVATGRSLLEEYAASSSTIVDAVCFLRRFHSSLALGADYLAIDYGIFDPGSRFPQRLERHAYYYL